MVFYLVFAKFLAGENKFISSNWNYSTELRVIQTQLVMMPLFKIFSDWHTIRVVGSKILFRIYNFHSYEMLEYTEFSWEALGKTINGIMRNFGWRSGEGIFSLATICNLVCILLLGLSIWILIKVIRKQIDYGEEIYITSIFCVVAMVILAAVYSLTYLGYEDRYSFPILIFLVPIVTIFLQSMIDMQNISCVML